MANKIKIVPDDFQKAVMELQRIESILNEYKTDLESKYSTMRNDWHGAAGEAFGASGQKILDYFGANIASLRQLTMDIKQSGQFMEETDQQIAVEVKRIIPGKPPNIEVKEFSAANDDTINLGTVPLTPGKKIDIEIQEISLE